MAFQTEKVPIENTPICSTLPFALMKGSESGRKIFEPQGYKTVIFLVYEASKKYE